jgi:hypothetical protein
MPRGPKGERRPADVIGNAVHVMRIATGQIEDEIPTPESGGRTQPPWRSGGEVERRAPKACPPSGARKLLEGRQRRVGNRLGRHSAT